MRDLLRVRRGTAAEAAASNPVLAAGEPGYETDTGVFKVGDGATAWSALPSVGGGGGGETVDSMWVPAGALMVSGGTAAEANTGPIRGWSMPAGSVSNLVGSILLPPSWPRLTVTLFWLNPNAAGGTAEFRFDRDFKGSGEGTAVGSGGMVTPTAEAQSTLTTTVVLPAWTGVEPDLPLFFRLSRFTGGTLAGAAVVHGLRFDRA